MIDLATWNLSIPVGIPAAVIDTPLLVGGYQDYYFKTASGNVIFWAPVNGTTTPSASYPRSELRETFADGTLRNWTYSSADNFLRASLRVTQVPSSGRIVIGQIHAHKSTQPLLKLEYQHKSSGTANVVAKVRLTPAGATQIYTVATGISLDQRFTYSIHLTPKGTLAVNVNGAKWSTRLDSAWEPKPLYFKAGVYPQDNSGYETEAGSATFYKLETEHRALPTQ